MTKALNRSLYSLSQPPAVIAIALLLLNDHVLKTAVASWWTGKLSDVAGLFFFPFVVIALLALILDQFEVPSTVTGRGGFWLVGGWFASMKTIPLVNEGTTLLWERLVAHPVHITIDPTDLLALVVLWPAWRVWQRSGRVVPARRRTMTWSEMILLAAASAASLATSCNEPHAIYEVFTGGDEAFYAVVDYGSGATVYRYDMGMDHWEPSEVDGDLPEENEVPAVSCVPNGPCYRVTGDEQVWKSEDGGETWQVVWAIPPGRRAVMQRYHYGFCDFLNIGPYDVVASGTASDHRVVVALGTEGALMRHPSGEWERQAVGSTEPTLYTIMSPETIVAALSPELLILVLGTMIVTSALYAYIWRSFAAFLLGVLLGPLLITLTLAESVSFGAVGLFDWWIVFLIILAMWLFLAFKWLRNDANVSEARRRSALKWWLLATLAIPVGFPFMLLWLTGPVARYETARGLWAAVALVLVVIGTVRTRKSMRDGEDLAE